MRLLLLMIVLSFYASLASGKAPSQASKEAPSAASEKAPTAAILPIRNALTQTTSQKSSILRNSIRRAMLESGVQTLALSKVDKGVEVWDTNCTSVTCMSPIAKALQVEMMLGGTLKTVKEKGSTMYYLNLWLMDDTAPLLTKAADKCIHCDDLVLQKRAKEMASTLLRRSWEKQGGSSKLHITSIPPKAEVIANGTLMGITDLKIGVFPGRQTVTVRKKGFTEQAKTLFVAPHQTAKVPFTLIEIKKIESKTKLMTSVLKWTTLGLAVAGIASGIALTAMHNSASCEPTLIDEKCDEYANSKTLGISFLVIGGLSAVASGALFYFD